MTEIGANTCTGESPRVDAYEISDWLTVDVPDFRYWSMDAQGDMICRIYKRLVVRREGSSRANVLRHFELITED